MEGVTHGAGRRQWPGPQAAMEHGPRAFLAWLPGLLTQGLASGWVLAVSLVVLTV